MLWQARQGLIAGRAALDGAAAPTDPNFSSVKFLSDFPGVDAATTLTEESAGARTVTFAGNAQIDTAQFKWSPSSLLLDGNGDLVTCLNSADFQFGNGHWTVECWARYNARPAGGSRCCFVALYDTNNQRSWYCGWNGSNTVDLLTSTAGSSGTVSLSTSLAVNLNQWYFFEYNYDGTSLRAFTDGVFLGKAAFASTLFASTAKLSIGGILTSGSPSADYFNGWIGGVRITKGVCRNPSDSNYTAPTAAFPRS